MDLTLEPWAVSGLGLINIWNFFLSDSPYFEKINAGIMELHDDGIVDSIREKWVRYSERNCERVNSVEQVICNCFLMLRCQHQC